MFLKRAGLDHSRVPVGQSEASLTAFMLHVQMGSQIIRRKSYWGKGTRCLGVPLILTIYSARKSVSQCVCVPLAVPCVNMPFVVHAPGV